MSTLRRSGTPVNEAVVGVVLIHGRGASAESILQLGEEIGGDRIAYVAPQAPGYTWYPNSFLAPLEANEPGISDGIATVMDAAADLQRGGIAPERIVLVGFSQGACLVTETAARNPRRYGGVVALSGGLIGNGQMEGAQAPNDKRFEYTGSLSDTPVFIGCSDVDPHIPVERVRRTADVFRELDADVTLRIYEGMGHTVNQDELTFMRELVSRLAPEGPKDS